MSKEIIPLEACFQATNGIVSGPYEKRYRWDPKMPAASWEKAMALVAERDLVMAVDAVLVDIHCRELSSPLATTMAIFLMSRAVSLAKTDPKKAQDSMRAALPHGGSPEFLKRYAKIAAELGMGPKG